MSKRAFRKPQGRRPEWLSARLRRPGCRGCPLRRANGECRDSGLWSGRCGDYVWYVIGNRQHRRLYVKPKNTCTLRQHRWRTRFGDASSNYSSSLTDEQQDACIAAGAKRRCRPRLGPSGELTGQQFLVHRELAGKAERPRKSTRRRAAKKDRKPPSFPEVPQPQVLTQKWRL